MTAAISSRSNPHKTLRNQAVNGAKWSAVAQACKQVSQFTTVAILANLLAVEDFGIVAIATVVTGFIGIFKDMGTGPAVVRDESMSGELLSTIWWVNFFFGLAATIALLFGAPFIGAFFSDTPETLVRVLRVLSFSFIISGPAIVPNAILQKELAFRQIGIIEVTSILCGAAVGISMAFAGFGVWSLVFQTLALTTVSGLMTIAFAPFRPSFHFDWPGLKSVSGFSLNLTGFTTFNYFARNADYFLIFRLLGEDALGFYTMAYRLMLYPLQNLTAVIGRVMFPVLSRVKDDDLRFRQVYLKIVSSIALITFPIMTGLFLVARPFVLSIYGAKWEPAIAVLLILAPVGMAQSITSTVGAIYQSKGRSDWMFRWGICTGTLLFFAFWIGTRWGIEGVAWSYLLMSMLILVPAFAIPFRLIHLSVWQLYDSLRLPLLCSCVMALVVSAVKMSLPIGASPVAQLGVLVSIGIATYSAATWLLNREKCRELYGAMTGSTR